MPTLHLVTFDALGRIRAPFTPEPLPMPHENTPNLKPTLAALVASVGWENVLDALSCIAWDETPRPYGDVLAEHIDNALAIVEA